MLQRQADAIQAVEHAVAAEIVDLKAVGFIPGFNYLRFQIHFKGTGIAKPSVDYSLHRG